MSQIFGPIRQLGLVVNNFKATLEHWVKVQGVGPFYYFCDTPVSDYRYHGKPTEAPVLSIAFAYSGNMQIEIIHQQNTAPSIYQDFILAGKEGLHHVSGFADRQGFEQICNRAKHAGLTETCAGNIGGTRFSYFDTDRVPGATICEISESDMDGPRQIFADIQNASINWDGNDPFRLLGLE